MRLESNITTIAISLLLMISAASQATVGSILFVDDDAAADGNGASWDTAYRFLQDGLTDAAGGGISEIHVAQGTYKPDRDEAHPFGTDDRAATFQMLNGIAIMGGYAGIGAKDPDARDFELFETILTGDLLGNDGPDFNSNEENSYHVTTRVDAGEIALLEGLTITHGNANGDAANLNYAGGGMLANAGSSMVTSCKFVENFAEEWGGGISSMQGSMILVDCLFLGNGSFLGGGLSDSSGSLSVTDCTFEQNLATNLGGAIILFDTGIGSQIISECLFLENTSAVEGGAIFCNSDIAQFLGCSFIANVALDDGGAMQINSAVMLIQDCTFTNNNAELSGGAISTLGSQLTIRDSSFLYNTATISSGGAIRTSRVSLRMENCVVQGNESGFIGGGICISFANETDWIVDVINCQITNNTTGTNGGGFFVLGNGTVRLSNCTIFGNSAGTGGGFFSLNHDFNEHRISNTILWSNQPNQIALSNSILQVNHSNVQFAWPGGGNIDADPMFVSAGKGDYHLLAGSPCIDAGHNWGVPVDVDDYDQDHVFCELFPVDLDDNPRFNADEADFDPGCGVPVVVDIGAYEYQFDPVEQIAFADLTADGVVNTLDLLILFAEWGECVHACCLADLDIDGSVNTVDLLILFSNWGTCP